ncbi:MAG: hypothetical protein M1816_004785 [Peltula sp. TS41687]|nr:MAG: hypothetical protein M1816_004785 [Peltula sp. TS41687]
MLLLFQSVHPKHGQSSHPPSFHPASFQNREEDDEECCQRAALDTGGSVSWSSNIEAERRPPSKSRRMTTRSLPGSRSDVNEVESHLRLLDIVSFTKVLGTKPGPRPGSRTSSGLENKKEFMPVEQVTERPILIFSHLRENFKWFFMINEKASLNTRDNSIKPIFGVKKTAPKFSVPNVPDWRRSDDRFRLVFYEAKLDVVYGT